MTPEEYAEKYARFALRTLSMDGVQERKYLTELFVEAKAEQRQMCANRVLMYCEPEQDEELRRTCLNATGESDET